MSLVLRALFTPPIIGLTNQRRKLRRSRLPQFPTSSKERTERVASPLTPPPKRRRVPFRARRFVPANKLINEQTSGDINERQEPIISADMNVAQSKQGRVVVLFLLPLLATGSLTFARPIQFSDLLRKEKLSSHEMYFFFL